MSTNHMDTCLAYLKKRKTPARNREVALALGLSQQQAAQTLRRLFEKGLIQRQVAVASNSNRSYYIYIYSLTGRVVYAP